MRGFMLQFACLWTAAAMAAATDLGAVQHPLFPYPARKPDRLPQNVTVLKPEQVKEWVEPALYASAAYCSSKHITDWTCGPACDALPKPKAIIVGGDGGLIPRYFIATLPDQLLISISGTDASNPLSINTDLDVVLISPESTYFPEEAPTQVRAGAFPWGWGWWPRRGRGGEGKRKDAGLEDILVHQGFYKAFERMRPVVESSVRKGLKKGNLKAVRIIGHSMGGSLAQLMGVYLQSLMGHGITVRVSGFASTRVGNEHWASYADEVLGNNSQFMVNYADNVPHFPPRLWGYRHSAGEVWIQPDHETMWQCEGQENPDCSASLETLEHELELVKSFAVLLGLPDHLGPYAGVTISDLTCPH